MSSETGRIEAFSDGVYAIAITLLILGLCNAWRANATGRVLAWLKHL
jgi:uncharacterized membrane protein